MTRRGDTLLSSRRDSATNGAKQPHTTLTGAGKDRREAHLKNTSPFYLRRHESTESVGGVERVRPESMHARYTRETAHETHRRDHGRRTTHDRDGTPHAAAQRRDGDAHDRDDRDDRDGPIGRTAAKIFFFRAVLESVRPNRDGTTAETKTARRRPNDRTTDDRPKKLLLLLLLLSVTKMSKVGGVRPPLCYHFGNSGFVGGGRP